MCTFFGGSFGFTSLLLHDVTRCFRRVCKKPYKNRVCLSTLLLDAEETEKRRKKKAPKKVTPNVWVALKTGRKQFHHFCPKNRVFQNPQKPYFIAFPEKMGGNHFFSKRLCYKEDRLRGKKQK